MALLIIALLAMIIIIGIHTKKKDKKTNEKPNNGHLIVSDSFLSNADSTLVLTNNNHVISQLYFHKPEVNVWTCPYCECENSTRESYCAVCFSVRKE